MPQCPNCDAYIPENEPYCPYCANPNPTDRAETIREIEEFENKRKRVLATFVLGMFGIMLIPFFRLVLATVSFGIAVPLSVFYTWKKHQIEKKLEKGSF